MQDYGGSGTSPGSPEMQHCSSTTQPLGTPEVKPLMIIILRVFVIRSVSQCLLIEICNLSKSCLYQ